MADIAAAMAKRGLKPLTDEDLRGESIDVVKCRACSGYGNCGYKTYHLYEKKALSICNMRKEKYAEENGLTINF